MRTLLLRIVAIIAFVNLAMFYGAGTSFGDDPKESTSLKFVPEKVAFYGTSLRHKEMLDRIASSNAYKKMVEHKVLSFGISKGAEFYEGAIGQFNSANPGASAALRGFAENGLVLLGDMFSHECFWYGGEGWVDSAPRMQAISNKFNSLVSQFAQLSEEERNAKFLEVLDDSEMKKLLGALRTPETVLGFKVTNKKLADDQLTAMAAGIKLALTSNTDSAPFAKTYKAETLSGGAFHVFTLDLNLLTPEVIEKIAEASPSRENVPAIMEKLKVALKNWKIVISFGRIEDYLILSIANDNQHLANWGKGKLLYDTAEFEPLRKAGDKEYTDISYTSKALAATASNPAALEGQVVQARQIRDQLAQAGISGELPITEDSIKKLTDLYIEDLEKLQKFAAEEANPLASVSFTYDVDEGFETMSYAFGVDASSDAGKPLSILAHVGKAPILFAVGRGKSDDNAGEIISYLAHRALEFVDAVEFGDDEEGKKMQEVFDKAAEKGKPIVEKFVTITTEKIIPALKDGQSALVVDATLTTDRLNPALPPSEQELLLPEVAIVLGVSDAALLREGLKDFLNLGRELINAIRDVSPEAIPEGFTIPDPEVAKEDDGEVASYSIPSDAEIVGKFLFPALGLGKDVAVLALHRGTAKRLLAETEIDAVAEDLEDSLEKPLASASQFDFHRFMDLSESYLAYAAQLGAFEGIAQGSPFSAEEIQEQIELVLNFLRCYERTTSVTYVENGMTVTRSISVYSDYEEDAK